MFTADEKREEGKGGEKQRENHERKRASTSREEQRLGHNKEESQTNVRMLIEIPGNLLINSDGVQLGQHSILILAYFLGNKTIVVFEDKDRKVGR